MAVVLATSPALAGPPFATDDPVPVDYQHWEINLAAAGTLVQGGGIAALPSLDINYGLLPAVQFHVQPQLAAAWSAGERAAGPGDIQVGAKIRLLDEDRRGWLPAIAVYPIYTAPAGDAARGLGEGHGRLLLPVWIDKTLGRWILDGGAGLSIGAGSRARNAWFAGGLLLYQVSDAWQLGGELFVQTAQARRQPDAPGFNLGGSYDISRTYHLLFSAGRGLAHVAATDRASFYLGLQVTF